MKFICEKCRTKYSIADAKVRRKVLKIRCKNCANIIVVRESPRENEVARVASGGALDAALDGAFAPGPRPVPPPAAPPPAASSADLAAEATGLTAPPRLLTDEHDDEWYLAVDGHQYGPMSFSELSRRVKRGEARSDTGEEVFVWRDGFDDWAEITTVAELRPYVPPPPPRIRSGLFPVAALEGRAEPTGPAPPSGPPPGAPVARPPTGQAPFVTGPQPDMTGAAATGRPMISTPQPLPAIQRQAMATPAPLPAPSPPPPAAIAPSAEQGFDVVAPDFGLQQSPSALAPLPVAPLSAPAQPTIAPAPAPGTPVLIKIAAGGGIVSTLTGIAILVYFLAFDHPAKHAAQAVAPPAVPAAAAADDPGAGAEGEGDGEGVAIDFPPMEVERSKADEKAVRGGSTHRASPSKPAAKATAKADSGSKLTAEQKRLMALYGKAGAAGVPSVGHTAKKKGPTRRLGSSDLTKVQRSNARSLKACYERALKRDQSLSDVRVDAELSIGDSGVVTEVRLSGVSSVDLTTCLKRSMRRWVFPAVGAQDISFPLIFRGSS